MTATASKHETIVQALVDRLETIAPGTASAYWYQPDRVLALPAFTEDVLQNSYSTLWVLSPDIEEHDELTFTTTAAVMRLDVVGARRFARSSDNPYDDAETRWQGQNKLAQDGIAALRGDLDLSGSGGAIHVRVTTVERSPEETYHPAWVLVYLRVEVMYTYADTVP